MNTYELMGVHIDTSQGTAKPLVTVRVRDTLTPVSGTFNQAVTGAQAQAKADGIVADTLAFLFQRFGVAVVLPPVPPLEN